MRTDMAFHSHGHPYRLHHVNSRIGSAGVIFTYLSPLVQLEVFFVLSLF